MSTTRELPEQREFGHPLIPDLLADPSIAQFGDTFYCYGTTDGAGAGLSTSGLPVAWKSTDFLYWSFAGSLFSRGFDAKYWAPSSPIRRDGRYYLWPTLDERITAVVADSPEGPFRALDGTEITRESGWRPFNVRVGKPIDADVFVDDDGSAYMVWAQRGIAKLKPDFSDLDGEQTVIQTKRDGYSEGPILFKREDIYYYLYTLGGHEEYRYAYMMSRTSPLGPWEAPDVDIICETDYNAGVFGPGHGCVFNPIGSAQWYLVYLEFGRARTNRQIYANKMNFNVDGSIEPIKVDLNGIGPLASDAACALPNLALGQNAMASTTRANYKVPHIAEPRLNRIEGYVPGNAINGSNGSRWLAAEGDTVAWNQLDLGEARDINRTELYFVNPTAGHAYLLEYSLDRETWHLIGKSGFQYCFAKGSHYQ